MLALMDSMVEGEMKIRTRARYTPCGLGALLALPALCAVAGTDRICNAIFGLISFIGYSVFWPLSMLVF